jgi:hypothetical protein
MPVFDGESVGKKALGFGKIVLPEAQAGEVRFRYRETVFSGRPHSAQYVRGLCHFVGGKHHFAVLEQGEPFLAGQRGQGRAGGTERLLVKQVRLPKEGQGARRLAGEQVECRDVLIGHGYAGVCFSGSLQRRLQSLFACLQGFVEPALPPA